MTLNAWLPASPGQCKGGACRVVLGSWALLSASAACVLLRQRQCGWAKCGHARGRGRPPRLLEAGCARPRCMLGSRARQPAPAAFSPPERSLWPCSSLPWTSPLGTSGEALPLSPGGRDLLELVFLMAARGRAEQRTRLRPAAQHGALSRAMRTSCWQASGFSTRQPGLANLACRTRHGWRGGVCGRQRQPARSLRAVYEGGRRQAAGRPTGAAAECRRQGAGRCPPR